MGKAGVAQSSIPSRWPNATRYPLDGGMSSGLTKLTISSKVSVLMP
jgi:hypothetical protein